MASKADYLKKYLRSKGPRRLGGPLTRTSGLKLGSDEEQDVQVEGSRRSRGLSTGPAKKTLFKRLRKAKGGDKYLFENDDAEEDLPQSDEEEVRVVGEDGQTLVLSEADKKRVAELIAKEEGRGLRSWACPGRPTTISSKRQKASDQWTKAFLIEETPAQASHPASASTPCVVNDTRQVEAGNPSLSRGGQQSRSPSLRRRDEDLSPRRLMGNTDLPPLRATSRDRDLSPPRRRPQSRRPIASGTDEDLSPPRRTQSNWDSPLPQDRDLPSAIEKRQHASAAGQRKSKDLPSARQEQQRSASPQRVLRDAEERELSPIRRNGAGQTFDGEGSSGDANRVVTPRGTSGGASRTRSEAPRGDPSTSTDSFQKVVFRDREGRIISEEEWLALEGARGKRRPKERGPAPVLEWGSGLKQIEDKRSKQKEEERLARQPFARYEIDAEYDADLRARDRWADPLANAPKSKMQAVQTNDEESTAKDNHGMQQRPACPHDAPPNRFNIKPGYRWDGVVRGNGYEEERLKAMNRRKWEAEMAHMNNTADM